MLLALCRSGVVNMKPRSAFGVTTDSVINCVDCIARTSCTSDDRFVLAAFCSSRLSNCHCPYSTRQKRCRQCQPSSGTSAVFLSVIVLVSDAIISGQG